MFIAIVSLLTGRHVRPDVAMTGEITLRGMVLPVGGIKEKILAAHRAGIKRVVLPERNKKDLIDVPDEIQKEMEIVGMKRINEVMDLVLEPATDVVKSTPSGGSGGGKGVVPPADGEKPATSPLA
jgi:ATP-dependent Lon protease